MPKTEEIHGSSLPAGGEPPGAGGRHAPDFRRPATGRAAPLLSGDFLVFEVGGQRYGIPSSDVAEVLRAVTPVPLPRAPAIVEGVFNLRGTVIPVLDIRSRFELSAKPVELTDHLVVARAGERLVAIRADRAVDLLRLAPDAIEDASRVSSHADYLAGVAKLADGLVLLHDLRTFLAQAEAEALADSLAEDGAAS